MPEIDSVTQGRKELMAQHRLLVASMWAVTVVLIAVLLGFFYFVASDGSRGSFSQVWFLSLFPLLIPVAVYTYYSNAARHQMVAQIGSSFGYTYAATAPVDSISGAIFSRGFAREIRDVLTGLYRTYPVRIFSYSYKVQEGKHTRTFTNTVCEFTYPSPLPHIVLLPHATLGLNDDVGMFSGLGSLQKAELEGDFGKYFDLYVEPDAQIQVREILPPDVMQDFIQRFTGHDVEINGTKVYVLEHGPISTRAGYVALHGLADTLIDKLIPGLSTATQA